MKILRSFDRWIGVSFFLPITIGMKRLLRVRQNFSKVILLPQKEGFRQKNQLQFF